MRHLVALVLIASCSSPVAPAAPTHCNKTDRHGVYRLDWTEQSGNCGPVASQLISLDDQSSGNGCTLQTDNWSEGDCKNERTFTCVGTVPDTLAFGGSTTETDKFVSVTRQETQDGSKIDGTFSLAAGRATGEHCQSTYGVSAIRQ